jgi:hypothetical protein
VKSEYDDRFLKALSNVVSFVTNEAVVLAQYETVQEGRFAWLWPADDNGEFDERVHRVVEHLGGPSQLYVIGNDEEPPLIDNYPAAAMREAIAVFSRARKTPFCLSSGDSGGVDFLATLRDEREDFSREVTLQRSNGVEFGMAF